MICEECYGNGYVVVVMPHGSVSGRQDHMVCSACGGHGVTYCCEGLPISDVQVASESWSKE